MQKVFFSQNRQRLVQLLPDALIVIPAHAAVQYSADVAMPFRQESHFWYLTGLQIADAVLVLNGKTGESKLLVPKQNSYQKEWDGALDADEITKISGITEIGVKADLNPLLKRAAANKQKIGYLPAVTNRVEPYGFYANPARRLLQNQLRRIVLKEHLVDIRPQLASLRSIKQPDEIEAIQTAIDITGNAMAATRKKLASFEGERELMRTLVGQFYLHGADGNGFHPIIAAGKSAAIIHYEEYAARIQPDDTVLLDVGALHGMYTADISRVWSVSGRPSARQKELWSMVLEMQQYVFDRLKAGVLLTDVQADFDAFAQKQFIAHNCQSMIGKRFPHGISHHLGIDVHDAGRYDQPLPENAIITVEPGVYLPEESIGMRVEDNVRITSNGIVNLSAGIPNTL